MKRLCTTCLASGIQKPAHFVSVDETGLMWFDCGEHSERDNVAGVLRTRQEPIEIFLGFIGTEVGKPETDEPCPTTQRDHS
jgi:hypothetical protein